MTASANSGPCRFKIGDLVRVPRYVDCFGRDAGGYENLTVTRIRRVGSHGCEFWRVTAEAAHGEIRTYDAPQGHFRHAGTW